jgi:hypothetical protein
MRKSTKLILFVTAGVVGLVVLVAAIAALLLTVNAKPRAQALASNALGMDVKIGGRVDIGILPGLRLALADVHVGRGGAEVASVGELDLGIALLPLLRRDIRIESIRLKRLTIALERGRDGKLNVGRSSRGSGPIPALDLGKVSVSEATLVYTDQQSGQRLEAANCAMEVSGLRLSAGETPGLLKNLSFAGKLSCETFRTEEFTATDMKLQVQGREGIFDFDPITMRLFGGHGFGNVRADASGSVPVYRARYQLAQFQIEELFKVLSPKHAGAGSMDFAANLSLRGKSTDELKRSASGEAAVHGENVRLGIGDLDSKFARYESSQSFNLVDVGAFFFAGPIGLGVTKGFNFARIFEGSEGSTMVRTLVSHWQVENGVAHATDVALATPKNRVAMKGALDFVNGQFDDVTVALVDAKGCSSVEQKIHGPFHQPQVEKPSVLAALAGPARKLRTQAKGLLGGRCEAFYTGSVAPPK